MSDEIVALGVIALATVGYIAIAGIIHRVLRRFSADDDGDIIWPSVMWPAALCLVTVYGAGVVIWHVVGVPLRWMWQVASGTKPDAPTIPTATARERK